VSSALSNMAKSEKDPFITVDGTKRMKLSEIRSRVSEVLNDMANGIYKGDTKAEDYAAASFGSSSELYSLIKSLIQARKLK